MGSIGNTKTTHAVCVAPFSEMSLEGFGSFVGKITADFTVVAYVQSVQLVQPVRNGLHTRKKK